MYIYIYICIIMYTYQCPMENPPFPSKTSGPSHFAAVGTTRGSPATWFPPPLRWSPTSVDATR